MSMFCYQCQEAAGNTGCTKSGVCGKSPEVANLQDVLIHTLKGISSLAQRDNVSLNDENKIFIMESLFATITNANFDDTFFENQIKMGLKIKAELKKKTGELGNDAEEWFATEVTDFHRKAEQIRINDASDQDKQSLRELTIYGLKGVAAYAQHAFVLGYRDESVFDFLSEGLAATVNEELSMDDLIALVMRCGEIGVTVMELLDRANTSTYGNPEPTQVNIGVAEKPGILVSGHDLKDLEELLEQTKGSGVDVYTHGEMLPAHYYPKFKEYSNFIGNYGGAWWNQKEEFEKFNGPVLLTTNCLVPPKSSYKERIYTTGVAGFEGCTHIPQADGPKDFSRLIEHAKACPSPVELEKGEIVGGFAHNTILGIADKVIEAINAGDIRKFVVMAGCDGRQNGRGYYTEFAEALPEDTIILTAGCAKYRYNKLPLGDIGGIPRVLDAGQCNDSYSLAKVAIELAKVLDVELNDLPISYNIAWYEQKAVIVLLALLFLGVKDIHLGPTLPAFLSPNVAKVLVDNFGIAPISSVEEDVKTLIGDVKVLV
jgi:hydroxylamine reductase